MSEQAQVGDTVKLKVTVRGKVHRVGGLLCVNGYVLDMPGHVVEILSRATPPLPSEPGTWWLDNLGDLWRVSASGALFHPIYTNPESTAPFRQLVLK